MNPTATELYNQFKIIEVDYGTMLNACSTESQREQLRTLYNQAWKNYNLAILKDFDGNDPRIVDLQQQIASGQQQIQNAIHGLNDISQTLSTIASIVSIGASLILAVG